MIWKEYYQTFKPKMKRREEKRREEKRREEKRREEKRREEKHITYVIETTMKRSATSRYHHIKEIV
jgi:hypothetical protein